MSPLRVDMANRLRLIGDESIDISRTIGLLWRNYLFNTGILRHIGDKPVDVLCHHGILLYPVSSPFCALSMNVSIDIVPSYHREPANG